MSFYFFLNFRLCLVKHEVLFEVVLWRTALFMIVFPFAVNHFEIILLEFLLLQDQLFLQIVVLRTKFAVSFENILNSCIIIRYILKCQG